VLKKKKRLEQKEGLRRIFLFGTLSLFLVALVFTWGIRTLANLAFLLNTSPEITPSPPLIFISPPILFPLPSATNSAQLRLSGFSQKESNVEVFLNGETQGTVKVDDKGQFEKEL